MSKSTYDAGVETTTGGSGGRGGGGPRITLQPILLLIILIAVLYIAFTVSKKPPEKSLQYYQLLPYNGNDSTAVGGSGGQHGGPRLQADTFIIYHSGDSSITDCPCCPKTMMFELTSTDSTHDRKPPR